ncbi:MAG: CinA family protein [Ruminococcus sp.]|nr:CinA family protein [Ruminococcus sp.]
MCNVKNSDGLGSFKFAKDNKVVTKRLDIVTSRVVKYMIAKCISLSAAESCTGGLISQSVTSVPGASAVYHGGVCSYTEDVKREVLGVSGETLRKFSVYSPEVASEMSAGVMKLMRTDAAIGVTGIAGPAGGSDEKPVGTVFVSVRYKDRECVRDLALYKEYEQLDRESIRILSAAYALEMLEQLIKNESEVC